jgi:hypothetical protein
LEIPTGLPGDVDKATIKNPLILQIRGLFQG